MHCLPVEYYFGRRRPWQCCFTSCRQAPSEITQHLAGAVVPGRARHAAARMCACAAQVQPFDRRAVVRVAEQRARRPELVERQLSMEDVSAGEAELALQ